MRPAEIDPLDVRWRPDRVGRTDIRRSGRPGPRRGRARLASHRCRPRCGRSRGPVHAAAAGPAALARRNRDQNQRPSTKELAHRVQIVVCKAGCGCRPGSGVRDPETRHTGYRIPRTGYKTTEANDRETQAGHLTDRCRDGSRRGPAPGAPTDGDWRVFGRDPGAQRFSPLTQITPKNVVRCSRRGRSTRTFTIFRSRRSLSTA